MNLITACNLVEKIILREKPSAFQGDFSPLQLPLEDYCKFLEDKTVFFKTKLLLNTTGISHNNTLIRQLIHLIEISLYILKNKGIFLLGEQGTGKSTLFTTFFNEMYEKTSGALTTALLIGNANISNEDKIKEISVLLEKEAVLVEEFADENGNNDQTVSGTLKNALESGTFLKCKSKKCETTTTFSFAGNSYVLLSNLEDLKKIIDDIPPKYHDRGLSDRFPFIMPHFKSLFGKVNYVESQSQILPIVHLQQILKALRECSYRLLVTEKMGITDEREIGVYNPFIWALCILFYPNGKTPEWFIHGWVEFFKFFRSILLGSKIYKPFNKYSARLIVEILGYDTNTIEYIAFDNDRIILKFRESKELKKIALTGFGVESNKKEYEFTRRNQHENIACILGKDGEYVLIQKGEELNYDSRIYFDNLSKEHNEKKKSDNEFNKLMLERMDLYARDNTKFSSEEIYFRGIPEFYKYGILSLVQDIFGKKVSLADINLNDYIYDKEEVKILNFAKFISKDNK